MVRMINFWALAACVILGLCTMSLANDIRSLKQKVAALELEKEAVELTLGEQISHQITRGRVTVLEDIIFSDECYFKYVMNSDVAVEAFIEANIDPFGYKRMVE